MPEEKAATESPAGEKSSTRQRIGEELRAAGELGREALTAPGGPLDEARTRLLEWFRKIWKIRGGGLYAVGFAVTFLFLEARELLLDDIPGFLAIESFDAGAVISFAVNVFVDTMINTGLAFAWPGFVVQWQPPLGIILLVAGFVLFPRYAKPQLERWLFGEKGS